MVCIRGDTVKVTERLTTLGVRGGVTETLSVTLARDVTVVVGVRV